MPTVTRPKPKLVSKHLNPPAKVAPDVVPINVKHPKAHYVNRHAFTLLQWAPGFMLTVLVLSAIWIISTVVQTAHYSGVGRLACKQGALPEPQILCRDDDLNCLTDPTVVEVSRLKDKIRDRNVTMAKACISVM